VLVQRLPQGLRLHHVSVDLRAVAHRPDAAGEPVRVGVDQQVEAQFLRAGVAEGDHLAELPRRVDVQQRERQPPGREGLEGEVQQHRGILADRVEHHRVLGLGDRLPEDVDALGLQPLEVAEAVGGGRGARLHGSGEGGAHRANSGWRAV
jgi:hypothetical protein